MGFVREPYNYIQAKQCGCQIITVPPSIIEKIEKFGKPISPRGHELFSRVFMLIFIIEQDE